MRMSKRTASLGLLAWATAFLTTLGGAAAASDLMPLGGSASPPIGYVEMCARTPAACVQTLHPSESQLDAVRLWAGQARWAVIFADRLGVGDATASVETPPAPGPKPRTKTGPIKPDAKTRPASEPLRVFTDLDIDRLNAINRRINRAIRPASDPTRFGPVDHWSLPSDRNISGDCEDYVLAKRQALIEAGAPIEALSIAVVETRRGEIHAVLLVATPQGEVVLDNLSPWIVSWRETAYRWRQRQQPGSALTWVQPATQAEPLIRPPAPAARPPRRASSGPSEPHRPASASAPSPAPREPA
jgi:predicted transglutaminase-like cysteine proteinase